MKFKFTASLEDTLIFLGFAIFLFFVIAVLVANVHSLAVNGS